jgi:glutamate---cysteine ligase / carboxylate-amine ligase
MEAPGPGGGLVGAGRVDAGRALAAVFDTTPPGTLGVEEELMLCAPDTFRLAPLAVEALRRLDGESFHPELLAAQIESVTPPVTGPEEAAARLRAGRAGLAAALGVRARIVAAGAHPFCTESQISDLERYRRLAAEIPWGVRHATICGLHVHVAVGGAERSLAVHNALRSFLPEIAALAANSPFLGGADTGHASVRPTLFGTFPRTGVPPALASWEELADFLAWGRVGGTFADASFVWWDLRAHPAFGTLEVRVADVQTRVEDAAAIAALVQTLAAWLADRHDRGERLPVHARDRIAQNAWLAARDGLEGALPDLDSGRSEPTRARIAALLDALTATARRLGCLDALEGGGRLLAQNGAERQRAVAAREGMTGLMAWLAEETEAGAAP